MENDYQHIYDFAISKLEKDYNDEIKLIDELYKKHKDSFVGGYITKAIIEDLDTNRESFLKKYNWSAPSQLLGSPIHFSKYFSKCAKLTSLVYYYRFEVVESQSKPPE